MLDLQATNLACLLTRCKDGINIDSNKAIMAITTNNSISVNPRRLFMASALSFQIKERQKVSLVYTLA